MRNLLAPATERTVYPLVCGFESSAPYQEPGTQKARAELKSAFLADFGATVIREAFPELATRMVTRSAILHWPERKLEVRGS